MRHRINPTPITILGLFALGVTCLGACAQAPDTSALDTYKAQLQANKDRMTRFFTEVVNNNNPAVIDELLTADFLEHEEFPGLPNDRQGCHQFFAMLHTAFPDIKATITHIVAEDDMVVAEVTWSGTHQGEFMGIPASGNQVTYRSYEMVRIVNGQANEHWGLTDGMAMMRGMGAMDMPEEP